MNPGFQTIAQSFADLWAQTLQAAAPLSVRFMQAMVLVIVVRIVTGRLRTFARRGLSRSRLDTTTSFITDRTIVGAGWLAAALWVLSVFGLDLTAFAAAIGFLTVAISFAVQDVLKNLVSGIFLLAERPFRLGERIKVKEFEGTVEEVRVRVTILRQDNGSIVLVPNGMLFSEAIINRGQILPPEDVTVEAAV